MNKPLFLGIAIAASASSFAQFADATNIWTSALGTKATRGAPDFTSAYDNTINFTGVGTSSGAVGPANGSTGTFMDADDLNVIASEFSKPVVGFTFSSSNGNSVVVNASPTVVFWTNNANAPATLLKTVRFNPIPLSALSVNLWTYAPGVPLFTLPASGKIFMGVSWDNFADVTNSGISDLQLSKVGQGVFNPPVVGSSADSFWTSNGFGNNAVNNPLGITTNFGGSPVASFGDSLTTVPEPGSIAAVALGLLAFRIRRRSRK